MTSFGEEHSLYPVPSYRVWRVINPPGSPIYRHVHDPKEATVLIDKWAEANLNSLGIWGDAFGLEVYEDGEWQEWYSEDGDSITEVIDVEND